MKRLIFAMIICALACASVATAQTARRPMTIDDLLRVRRVGDPQLSPDGKWLAYSVAVPDKAANRSRTQVYLLSVDGGAAKALTSGEASSSEPRWSPDGTRIAFVSGGQIWTMDATGAAVDLTPGDADAPPFSLGGATDYAFSPDDKWVAYASNTEKVEATSTNSDLYLVPALGGQSRLCITCDNKGADASPQFSPDGRYIVYRSQVTPGYESDRWRLML